MSIVSACLSHAMQGKGGRDLLCIVHTASVSALEPSGRTTGRNGPSKSVFSPDESEDEQGSAGEMLVRALSLRMCLGMQKGASGCCLAVR